MRVFDHIYIYLVSAGVAVAKDEIRAHSFAHSLLVCQCGGVKECIISPVIDAGPVWVCRVS
jgi:hypothetical protein